MTAGELFVDIGIKGKEKAIQAFTGVKNSLGELGSMSLEAKAGILAVLYGFEQMMSHSAAAGASLSNFASYTGLSTQELQKWQYAAQQVGVSGDEITGSLKGVQGVMANMLLGGGAPAGFQMVHDAVGFDMNRARDTYYVMQQLQKFAQAVPEDVGNRWLSSFGLSEGTISAMRKNAFNENVFSRAPKYSEREIQSLTRAQAAWSNLGLTIQMAFGHFNAKHGAHIVKMVSDITVKIAHMADSFERLAEKLKLFKLLGMVFEGWGYIFDGINAALDKMQDDSTPQGAAGNNAPSESKFDKIKGLITTMYNADQSFNSDDQLKKAADRSARMHAAQTNNNHHVAVTQNFNNDGSNSKAVARDTVRGLKGAINPNPVHSGGI